MNQTRVLVVEDDPHLLTGIREILEIDNYKVLTAKNGQEGLTVLNSDPDNPPDVIVSDIMMPFLNGFQFLEAVRKVDNWVEVPFIFLTAKGEKEDKFMGRRLGADVYLTKPFDAEELLVTVESVNKRRREHIRVNEARLSKQKEKLMTILNHEFRTPLTLVVAYAEMLKDFDPNTAQIPEEEVSFLKGVYSGADRLRRLVENFITVVELDMGEANKTIGWRKRPVDDLRLVTDDAHRQVMLLYTRDFVINVPDDLPVITTDTQYLTIALRELLHNAAKFSDEEATITLNVYPEDNHMVFEVIDEGRGIPEKELDNIWQPFYQIEREKYEDQGAGSGLAIVKGIAKLHGGICSVESTLNEGSTFVMKLPLEPQLETIPQ